MQGANAGVMRSTTVWCARTHELAILHMHAKLLTKRKVYLRETVPSLRGGRVVDKKGFPLGEGLSHAAHNTPALG